MIDVGELIINIAISVIISGTISYFIARHFKLNVKPKIEQIYEYNRDFRIHQITQVIEFSNWNIEEIFKFLEGDNCVGPSFEHLNLTPELNEEFEERRYRLELAYNDVYKFVNDAKEYSAGDEFFDFIDFMTNSLAFADELSKEKYNPQYLRRRGKAAKRMVKRFEKYFLPEFVNKWNQITNNRLE